MNEQLTALQMIAEQAGSKSNTTREELDAVIRERDAALTSLTAAQKQIDHIIRDRDQVRKLATENALELGEQLTALQAQMAAIKTTTAETEGQKEQLAELRQRFEKQRVDTIDLATQFQGAQREIRELSASLAEARLQVKFAQAASRATKEGKTKSDFASLLRHRHCRQLPEQAAPDASPRTAQPKPACPATFPAAMNRSRKRPSRARSGRCAIASRSFTKTPSDSKSPQRTALPHRELFRARPRQRPARSLPALHLVFRPSHAASTTPRSRSIPRPCARSIRPSNSSAR